MPHRYLLATLLSAAFPAAAQPTTPPPAAPAANQATPVPGDTLLVQGQRQPARAFLTIQDQLRTVAGVQVTPLDGSPGAGQVVRVRGASLLAGSGQPLYVVDGLPALNDELSANLLLGTARVPSPYAPSQYYYSPTVAEQGAEAGANPLQLLPPESIASIEVLAGPAAVARYGPLAANGVISIRTRPLAGSRRDSLRWRVGYAAYGGVQQVRHRYALLDATDFAKVVNEAASNSNAQSPPFPSIALSTGTDWQAETYRLAGLQQHQLSVAGQGHRTGVLASIDYRQQAGVLRNSSLTRYGLRLGLDHRATDHLTLRGSVALGETDQRLPYTAGPGGAVQAALLAPPTEGVRTAQGTYAGYGRLMSSFQPSLFNNPVAVAELSYREPRTRRLLAQLGADYRLGADLTVQLSGNYQRTDLAADSYNPVYSTYYAPPTGSQRFAYQTYQAHQVAGRLAVRYQHRFGPHLLGAEVDYQYQQANYQTRVEYNYGGLDTPQQPGQPVQLGYYGQSARPRLHRPWAVLRYALADSLLTVEAGLSYAHFRDDNRTEYYPNAQVSYQPRLALPAALPLTVWVGAGRTGTLGYGYGIFGSVGLVSSGPLGNSNRQLGAFYTDQLEAGLRLGRAGGHFSAQLVGYGRRSRHVVLPTVAAVPSSSNLASYITVYDEGTVRNLGLELTLTGTWRAGPLAGTTRLAASANRNRVRNDEDGTGYDPTYDNHPAAAFYGYQPQGLTSTGTPRYRDANGDGTISYLDRQYLGSGIPAGLLSLSQQLRQSRWALDVQLDALLDYQVLNQQLLALDIPSGITNNAPTVLDRWTPTHTTTSIPVAGYRQYSVGPFDRDYAARLLESGSQLRLSALTLSYALHPIGRPELSVWASTQNLFVLSSYRGYDPNVSSGGSLNQAAGQDYGAVPVPRAFLLGIRAAL